MLVAVGNLVFVLAALTAIGFWLWAMASLVRASAAAKQSGLPIRNILALSKIERLSHPAYPHLHGFLNGMLGFTVTFCVAFVLSFWFGIIR
jgi:hypothetical protein